jgi:hypothetical protein
MPRAKGVPSSPGRRVFESQWAAQAGRPLEFDLLDWDPKPNKLFDAVMQVLASGAQVFIKPGSGGRSFGIAIWEGDDRHPATWFYEVEELDAWCEGTIARGQDIQSEKRG